MSTPEELAAKWLRDNDWDYQKYGDRREDRSAYDSMMYYEISSVLEEAHIAGQAIGFRAGLERAAKVAEGVYFSDGDFGYDIAEFIRAEINPKPEERK